MPILTSFKSALRPIKRAAAWLVEHFWRLGFGAAASFLPRKAARWESAGGRQILVVAPHPDDEAIGSCGTVLLHVRSGDRICVAIATDGRRSRVISDPVEMSRQRRREASDAARLMQVDRLEWIGLPEGEWSVAALKDALRALLEEVRPEIIYAPSRIDFHPEHLEVAHALALALREIPERPGSAPLVRVYQIQVPLNPLLTNLVADVSAVYPQCEAVLRAYASQAGTIRATYRQRRYSAAWHRIAGQAEEFWELSAKQYVALHGEPPVRWAKVFRALRPFPLTDPLAYLAGTSERRKLQSRIA